MVHRVGSSNMEGVVAEITAGSDTSRLAVPAGGSRLITLASPLPVSRATLTARVAAAAAPALHNTAGWAINAYKRRDATP